MNHRLERFIAGAGVSLILLISIAAAARAGSVTGQLTKEDLTRKSSAGGITIQVVFLNPLEEESEDKQESLRFKVTLDAHSGNLMKYNLTEIVELRTGDGKIISSGFIWKPESESSHHRSGVLLANIEKGQSPLGTGAGSIELVMKGIAVPTRTFTWIIEEQGGQIDTGEKTL